MPFRDGCVSTHCMLLDYLCSMVDSRTVEVVFSNSQVMFCVPGEAPPILMHSPHLSIRGGFSGLNSWSITLALRIAYMHAAATSSAYETY